MGARTARVAALAVFGLLLVPGSAVSGGQKPDVLTAIANIGTVYWRHDCFRYSSPHFSLGVRWSGEATTTVSYRTGTMTRRRTLPPRLIWFPFGRNAAQTLVFAQATEPGTLRARLTVSWRGGHCESYFPPRFTLQLYPR